MRHAVPTFCIAEANFLRRILPRRFRLFQTGACVLTVIVALIPHLGAAAHERTELSAEHALFTARELPNESAGFPLEDMGDLNSQRLDSTHLFLAASGGNHAEKNADEEKKEQKDDEEDEKDEDQITPIIQELFLGTIVYPQEKGEVQLTLGYFDGVEAVGNSETFLEIEYGITDRFKFTFDIAAESIEGDVRFEGVRNLGLQVYYNFYNDRRTCRAYGVGFEFGLPVDSAAGESRTYAYKPFFVGYQEYREFAVNLSAAFEFKDPSAANETTATAGEVSLGIFRCSEYVVPMLELQVEIAEEGTPARLAPGFYFKSFVEPVDVAVSFPIGLNNDAPDFGVYFLAIVEFEARKLRSGNFK
jgi:hypothetical protein